MDERIRQGEELLRGLCPRYGLLGVRDVWGMWHVSNSPIDTRLSPFQSCLQISRTDLESWDLDRIEEVVVGWVLEGWEQPVQGVMIPGRSEYRFSCALGKVSAQTCSASCATGTDSGGSTRGGFTTLRA